LVSVITYYNLACWFNDWLLYLRHHHEPQVNAQHFIENY